MKRIPALALAVLLALALTACKGQAEPTSTPPAAPLATPPAQTTPTAPQEADPTPPERHGPSPAVTEGSKYTFVYAMGQDSCKLPMNQEFTQLASYLGEPETYFEAESCAFQGLDKTYNYPGFELVTYPIDGVDYISNIYFTDGTVSTAEGIQIGSTLEEMTAAYGEDYTENFGQYSYTDGDTQLSFLIEDGKVASVEYLALNDQLA